MNRLLRRVRSTVDLLGSDGMARTICFADISRTIVSRKTCRTSRSFSWGRLPIVMCIFGTFFCCEYVRTAFSLPPRCFAIALLLLPWRYRSSITLHSWDDSRLPLGILMAPFFNARPASELSCNALFENGMYSTFGASRLIYFVSPCFDKLNPKLRRV